MSNTMSPTMKILLIGDIFGKNGVRAIAQELPRIQQTHHIDITIANAENVSACRGLTMNDYTMLNELGIDYFTMGNHTWKHPDVEEVLSHPNIVCPTNFDHPLTSQGKSHITFTWKGKNIRLINLMGTSVYFPQARITNPFQTLTTILASGPADINIVDFHCETTSEKNCMLQAFCGQVQVIVGTHTHVQTNDAQIYHETAYITDLGMCGSMDGIIGAQKEPLMDMFFERTKQFRLKEAPGRYQFCAVVVTIDDTTNLPVQIETIYHREV